MAGSPQEFLQEVGTEAEETVEETVEVDMEVDMEEEAAAEEVIMVVEVDEEEVEAREDLQEEEHTMVGKGVEVKVQPLESELAATSPVTDLHTNRIRNIHKIKTGRDQGLLGLGQLRKLH